MSNKNIKIYRAKWLLPISQSPIHDGDIVIDKKNNEIVDIGTHKDIRKKYSQKLVKDFGNSIIFPGFINTHVHLEENEIGEISKDYLKFLQMEQDIKSKSKKELKESIEDNLDTAYESGTLAFANFSKTGLAGEYILNKDLFGRVFLEISGFKKRDADEIFREYKKIIDKYPKKGNLTYHYAFSNLWSTSSDLLSLISANELHTALHFGLIENERNFFLQGDYKIKQQLLSRQEYDYTWETPGLPPIKYFLLNNYNAKHNILAHCCEITEEDIAIINDYDTKVNICATPRSDQIFDFREIPIELLQDNGLNVCLGTEGLHMGEDLNMRNEIRSLVEDYNIAPENALKIATLNGAYAIGFHREVGSLDPHKTANCLILHSDGDIQDPYETVVYSDNSPEWLLNK